MKKRERLLYFLALLKIIIPCLLQSPVYEPHRDELLALAKGQHLFWGYMDLPPLQAVFAWLTNLFGAGMFLIKFWPSLFGAATLIVAGKLVINLGVKAFALVLVLPTFIFGIYLRIFFLLQPNALEIFFLDDDRLQHRSLHSNKPNKVAVPIWCKCWPWFDE